MSGKRTEVKAVDYTAMFWSDMEAERTGGHYASMRAKLRQVVQHRLETGEPHPREKFFGVGELRGMWHIHLCASPLKVAFYDFENGVMRLRKLGNHEDYAWNGKGIGTDARTARAIARSDPTNVTSPLWPQAPRWLKPEDLRRHPDLPELSPAAFDALEEEIQNEPLEGVRFINTHGKPFTKATEAEKNNYLNEILDLMDFVLEVRKSRLGAHFDQSRKWERFAVCP